jgi:hypothetical protein
MLDELQTREEHVCETTCITVSQAVKYVRSYSVIHKEQVPSPSLYSFTFVAKQL